MEDVSPYKVADSIKKRYEVEIDYDADDGDAKGKGRRIIQPVAYGLSKGNNPVIRAFQPYGDTETKVPHWKMFRLDRIKQWKPFKNRKFTEPPQEQWGGKNVGDIYGKYNPNGDKSMSTVYLVADFEGAKSRYQKGGLEKYNAQRRQKRQEEDPLYSLRQNVKNSVMATPEIMKRIELSQREKEKKANRRNQMLKPNFMSSKEMSTIKNFGDNNDTQTEGPINKNNIETSNINQPVKQQTSYKNVQNNGPITKNSNNTSAELENAYNNTNSEEENNIENTEKDKL